MSLTHIGLAAILTPAIAAMTVTLGAVGAGVMDAAQDGTASDVTCVDEPVVPGTRTRVGRERLDAVQIANAKIIYTVGMNLGATLRGAIIAIATAMQESRLRNLTYGDRDSLGLFQQRSGWGPTSQRTTPASAATMFYTGGLAGQPGLIDIPQWETLSLTHAAQAVQRSALPNAYARWEPIATALATTFSSAGQPCAVDEGIDIPGDVTAALPENFSLPARTPRAVKTAIAWAAAQLGTPYHYGGSCTAPHSGVPAKQCDCSSLVQQAYRHAGTDLPRTTGEQINIGTPIYTTSALRPGDLLFLPGHVGIYLGSGLVLHAPKTGDVVKISRVKGYWRSNLTGIRRIIE